MGWLFYQKWRKSRKLRNGTPFFADQRSELKKLGIGMFFVSASVVHFQAPWQYISSQCICQYMTAYLQLCGTTFTSDFVSHQNVFNGSERAIVCLFAMQDNY